MRKFIKRLQLIFNNAEFEKYLNQLAWDRSEDIVLDRFDNDLSVLTEDKLYDLVKSEYEFQQIVIREELR